MAQILLVEDNRHNQNLFTTALRHYGHDVRLAEDGDAALKAVEGARPDLVVLDLSIPKIDGWTVARRLRDGPKTSDLPILALTAHAMKGDKERAIEAGCTAYLSKPVSPRELRRRIEQLLLASRAA